MEISMTQTRWLDSWQKGPAAGNNPFISDEFLTALEDSGVCSEPNGWQPLHLSINQKIQIPAYLKRNSWGEYVFDWSWANAYEQHGLDYYPKLIVTSPFTPSKGPRLLGADSIDDAEKIIDSLKETCHRYQLSGFHILFPDEQDQQLLDPLPLLQRTDIQYHWQNRHYLGFNDFLDRFKSRKRKNIRRERQAIIDQGIEIKTIQGADISQDQLEAFYQFYQATYLKRGRRGYLNRTFFNLIQRTMPDNIVLFMAYKAMQPVAAALCFQDEHNLYGRYWGCLEEFNNLHFETCYYHGIEYCIETGKKRFDPGTQGEHKISRGFEPVQTKSYHWLTHPGFFEAAKEFCQAEQQYTQQFKKEVLQSLPFKETL
jgi:predicted N-acyltransferase